MYYVYMLSCGDGSLYTGIAADVEKRLRQHQSGAGAKYTRSHLPVTLVYQELSSCPVQKSSCWWKHTGSRRLNFTGTYKNPPQHCKLRRIFYFTYSSIWST